MKLHAYVHELLSKKFTEAEMKVIDENWDSYIQMSFGNSSARQLIAAAKTVLLCEATT
jgi:hypothetical protein